MNSADSFSPDFIQARDKFREAAASASGALESITCPERGPDGEELSTDLAWFGPREAEGILVMISGTHGVEGFCGSGAQVDWLRRGATNRLPAGLAVLMIHAINPYGFAWLRRVTQENVDLNRNWIDFDAAVPDNPGYDELSAAVLPAEWSEASQRESFQVLDAYRAKYGMDALQQALSGGQYKHPAGIYYGGASPTWARRTQTSIFETYLANAARVAIIDYHTGLGAWGCAEPMITDPIDSAGFKRARKWYGAAITSTVGGDSTSADIIGDGLAAASALLPGVEVTGMALEIGVQPPMQVLNALRADAWLHACGDPLGEQGRAIKAEIRAAFYGDADVWKGMVAGQSWLTCRQAIAGLQR